MNEMTVSACSKQRDQSLLPESHAEWGQVGAVHTTQEQGHGPGQGHHQRGRGGGEAEAGARGQD